jgi:hypothetical protein
MKPSTNDVPLQPDERSSRRTARLEVQPQTQSTPDTEQEIRELIRALGDPDHPRHSDAIGYLVDIGSPAVPALSAALAPTYPWLTSYRAAEALAQIGDGRASGPLINALRHPNSNVRWSAIRALTEVGDSRTLLALRRVAREDRGKTSWGESVADTAQLALDRLQSRSALLRFSEPIKTALLLVVMVLVLAFAFERVQALRNELQNPGSTLAAQAGDGEEEAANGEADAADGDAGDADGNGNDGAADGDAAPPPEPEQEEPTAEPTAEPTTEPTAEPTPELEGTARVNANVRSSPTANENNIIGGLGAGDAIYFLEQRGDWYRIRPVPGRSPGSTIQGDEGWAHATVVNPPSEPVPSSP